MTQHSMKTNSLTKQQINQLLERAQTGSLATLNPDGTPHCTPIHFIYFNKAIFFHSSSKGKKLDNINHNTNVSFSVYEMDRLLPDRSGRPCNTNTKYKSVIISGTARLLDDIGEKGIVLKKIVEKYIPHSVKKEIPSNMVKGTAVVRVDVTEITGKYFA